MSEGSGGGLQVVYNLDRILDCHTHLTGMEARAPRASSGAWTSAGSRRSSSSRRCSTSGGTRSPPTASPTSAPTNDYCADVCSASPERLLGFCALNPHPDLAGGDLAGAVDLMVEEAHRCYDELGLRGAGEIVPTHWYPHDPVLLRLWRELARLGMYTVFHAGIFYDGRQSAYCRPAYFEAVRGAPGFKGHLAHVGWPWYDEGVAVLKTTTGVFGEDPAEWDLRVDLSFGPPTDWQLEAWQHCIDTLPPRMLMYGTDTFWPIEPEMYREQYLQPQLGLFETATTFGHIVGEGSPAREDYRDMIFYRNALDHWQNAVREPQDPRLSPEPIEAPNAHRGHSHG